MSETERGRDRERKRKKVFVVSLQLKLVYRTVMLSADWDGSSQYFMQKVEKNFFFLSDRSDCKISKSLRLKPDMLRLFTFKVIIKKSDRFNNTGLTMQNLI